jgi:acyl transferase domain-containing protein
VRPYSLFARWTTDSCSEELSRAADTSQVTTAILGQPLCTALQIALVHLLRSWRIEPVAVTGHSSGEIAAAYACGALTIEDALTVAYYRGFHASTIPTITAGVEGAMVAVGLSEAEVALHISDVPPRLGKMVVACVNSESSVTISGDKAAIDALQEQLDARGIFNRKLQVDTAYHSHHMNVIADSYLRSISHIRPRACFTGVTFWSSVVGDQVDGGELGPDYVSIFPQSIIIPRRVVIWHSLFLFLLSISIFQNSLERNLQSSSPASHHEKKC